MPELIKKKFIPDPFIEAQGTKIADGLMAFTANIVTGKQIGRAHV